VLYFGLPRKLHEDCTMKSVAAMWILLALAVTSALVVMTVRHQHRIVFDQFYQAREQYDRYQMDWGRLLLEEATWTTASRIDNIKKDATGRLGMAQPVPEEIVLIALGKSPD